MTCRRTSVRAAAVLMILVMNVFRGHSLTCRRLEYQMGNRCCPMCPLGFRVDTYCTEYRSTSCLRCTEGTFMNHHTDLPQCYTCTSCDAASGLKLKTSCTATSDAVCEPLEGFYCMDSAEEGCKAAEKHSSCQPGQYISQRGTALRDTECSDCSEGTYSDGTFPSCQPHTQCESEHRQLIKAGTVSTDAECGEQSSVSRGFVASVSVLVFLIAAAAVAAVAWYGSCLHNKNMKMFLMDNIVFHIMKLLILVFFINNILLQEEEKATQRRTRAAESVVMIQQPL
uniref:tumor necrosis factor receptor superfamily member 14-like isoform X2 n=1 Tax=Scatophagus argus TaxID=75038 RepID=UPI001ED7DA0C|nr:tumor necrosis factor receptor superfamily member 14-like isoform X2 [Scatophagus argus]XP_046253978.1 tumor necrosis factor receptor superfamily member 14-like isoform X2 [Scatophagus argus]